MSRKSNELKEKNKEKLVISKKELELFHKMEKQVIMFANQIRTVQDRMNKTRQMNDIFLKQLLAREQKYRKMIQPHLDKAQETVENLDRFMLKSTAKAQELRKMIQPHLNKTQEMAENLGRLKLESTAKAQELRKMIQPHLDKTQEMAENLGRLMLERNNQNQEMLQVISRIYLSSEEAMKSLEPIESVFSEMEKLKPRILKENPELDELFIQYSDFSDVFKIVLENRGLLIELTDMILEMQAMVEKLFEPKLSKGDKKRIKSELERLNNKLKLFYT